MTILDAIFVGVAVPEKLTDVSYEYWQTDASVSDIAAKYALRSAKAVTKGAGHAVLRGVPCKHCCKDVVVKNRGQAITEINTFRKSRRFNRVECYPCFRADRDRRDMERMQASRANGPKNWEPPTKKEKRGKVHSPAPASSTKEDFYKSWEWRTLRMEVLKEHGRSCQCCGAEPGMKTPAGDPVRICVDHIKPLSKFWRLRLDRSNLQVLCDECNQGKGNWDQTDFRPTNAPDEWIVNEDALDPALVAQLSSHGETIQ